MAANVKMNSQENSLTHLFGDALATNTGCREKPHIDELVTNTGCQETHVGVMKPPNVEKHMLAYPRPSGRFAELDHKDCRAGV